MTTISSYKEFRKNSLYNNQIISKFYSLTLQVNEGDSLLR